MSQTEEDCTVKILTKLFGTQNTRELKRYQKVVNEINALEQDLEKLSDEELRAKTGEFKSRLKNGETTDDILVEAFAVCREAGKRVHNMRHYDVQLIGGMVLNDGRIAEMKTGEGKTLVATLPVYLNGLTGKGVHVVTVNDYLASRDAEWMGEIYKFLGLTVGVIVHGISDEERQAAYQADITYGTNNEFGFDYLRDNMKFSIESMVQRPLNYAIVDEVDSILIDEARTPLIISGPSEKSTDKYQLCNQAVLGLKEETHYTKDEKVRSVTLTDDGVTEVERRLNIDNLYDVKHIELLHHVTQALKAQVLFKKDVDYVVKDGEVMIVDEFTGRIMPGRRWSDGLHQAVEAKEGVTIESENQTLASITYQNYFRMYNKLSGMTGTADTEAPEFAKIYNLDVVVIPTNRPNQRNDQNDVIYKTEKAKFKAIINEIKEENKKGRPILIGTIAIEKSEELSQALTRAGIRHNVLNAKQHGREAEIVAQAGRLGAVTVSTNMAGRGTDIVLGGNPEMLAKAKVDPNENPEEYEKVLKQYERECKEEQQKVLELGGLYVIGTERHESRRIDNQLRGRCGRQGDPGQTRFYISVEDNLIRIFGAEKITAAMEFVKMEEDDFIEHKLITRAIEGAQKKVEAQNFEARKNILEYDDVMNQQRQAIYTLRRAVLGEQDLEERFTDMLDAIVTHLASMYAPDRKGEYDKEALNEQFAEQFGFQIDLPVGDKITSDDIGQKMYDEASLYWKYKQEKYQKEIIHQALKFFMLQTLDELWKDHLLSMDHLREGIGLRGYGQKDPKMEYKKEGFALFEEMMLRYNHSCIERLFKVEIQTEEEVELKEEELEDIEMLSGEDTKKISEKKNKSVKREAPKVGRNDPCPCGSGKKYKKCHGVEEVA